MANEEGGLAQANPVPQDQGILGIFSQLNMSTQEAQDFSREYLEDYQAYDFEGEEELLEKFRETAEDSRAALQRARQDVLGEKFDQRDKWLAAAQALGAPTKTGSFGESIGALAGSLREPFAAEQQFREDQSEKLLGLDTALTGVDENMLMNEFKLQEMKRAQMGDLAKESLKQLGRQTPGVAPNVTQIPAIKSLDQKMATEYAKWASGGQQDVTFQIANLDAAIAQLDNPDVNISGPWMGLMPKIGRDVFFPESADVQETIETVAQRSLKAILGGQFGQREGEMLLERTFNPRLKESTNKKRAFRLMQNIKLAAKDKARAMNYYQTKGTMAGFDGQTEWTIADFEPPPEIQRYRLPDGKIVKFPADWTLAERSEYYDEFGRGSEDPVPEERARGGSIRRYYNGERAVSGYSLKRKTPSSLHIKRYAEGGEVKEFYEEDVDEDLLEFGKESGREEGFGPMDVGEIIFGTAAGTATGLGLEELNTRMDESKQGITRPSRAERLIGSSMDIEGLDPDTVVQNVKRSQRLGVPDTPMDVAGGATRELGQQAMMAASQPGNLALEVLETRHANSRERVSRQVEKGLRTPEFYATESKLTDRLYSRAKPLYKKAYADNVSLKMPPFFGKMFDNKYGKKAIKHAIEFMDLQGKTMGKADVTGMVQRPSLEFLDNVKKGFDQLIRKEEAMGHTPLGRLLRDQRGRLVRWLDNPENVTPTYSAARAQYKGDLEILEALDIGRREYYRLPAEEARLMVGDMSNAEKQALKSGMAQKLYDIIYGPSSDIASARRIIGSPEMRGRLKVLFDKPREFRVFEAALEREMDLWEKGKKTIRRVETGRQKRMISEVEKMDDPLTAMKEAISRGPIAWVLKTIGVGGGKGLNLTENQADEIVEILLTRRVEELDKIVPRLRRGREYAKHRKGRRGKAGLVGAAIGTGLAVADVLTDDN